MAEGLPVRKYVKVRFRRRRNKLKPGTDPTTSYTLYWREYGQKRFLSLGQYATRAYAERMAREKEAELNSPAQRESLKPITWKAFVEDYLNQTYPGHDLPSAERKKKVAEWRKSLGTMKREKLALGHFERLVRPDWCHELTPKDRDRYVTERLKEVQSAATLDAELRALHTLAQVMEEWGHRAKGENPFAGKTQVDERRRRHKAQGQSAVVRHYTLEQVRAVLDRADNEAAEGTTFEKKRLRVLAYFVAYTGCRINEAVHLEWADIDWQRGIATLYFKVENDLKTPGSAAPFGLPDALLAVLREWEQDKTCSWVFPNSRQKPWQSGAPGYRHFDQLQELGRRAGVEGANWKRFRHALSTLGKGHFGMTEEQVKAQLRHTTTETQKSYTHDDLQSLRDAVKDIDFRK